MWQNTVFWKNSIFSSSCCSGSSKTTGTNAIWFSSKKMCRIILWITGRTRLWVSRANIRTVIKNIRTK